MCNKNKTEELKAKTKKNKSENPFSKIPQVEKLLNQEILKETINEIGKPNVAKIASDFLGNLRKKVKDGSPVLGIEECAEEVKKLSRSLAIEKIQPVINATGIILHTNLGRSPLADGVWERSKESACSYSSIEMDLSDGNRGARFAFVNKSMSLLTGAEAALMLNNNAAAVFLMLKALAFGKEVIVARGQQVQIGGGFRIPEILEMAGARLVEVGTTNITTLKDIKNAITESTAMVLWVHTSNYKIRGFTEHPEISEIKKILPENIILAVDQGSGNLFLKIAEEPTVSSIIREGADLVCFSGDKILGGPQAGWIVGKESLVKIIAKNQLMRTYRVGRAVASLMQETLIAYLNQEESTAQKAINMNAEKIKARSEVIVKQVNEAKLKNSGNASGKTNPLVNISVVEKPFSLGGGSTPDAGFASWAIKIKTQKSCEKLKKALRDLTPPIIGFIEDENFYIHLASVPEKHDSYIAESLIENCRYS